MAKRTAPPETTATKTVAPPWERPGNAKRFEGHRVVLAGKLVALRKKEVVEVLKEEGASVAEKLDKDTTVFVAAAAGTADFKKAATMGVAAVDENEFRRRYLLPTADQAFAMLTDNKDGRARLAKLLELNRKPYMRSTDEYSTIALERRSFHNAKLGGVSLCGLHFIECDLREANLAKAEWLAEAVKSDFRKASAKELELVEPRECDFREANLEGASLREVASCRFEGANLTKASGSDAIAESRFDGANLEGFTCSHLTITNCSFEKASLKDAELSHSKLRGCNFTGADLRGATFKGDSRRFVIENCNLRGADLRAASLSHVRFENCDLTDAQFAGATIAELEFVDTDASKAKGLDQGPPAAHGPAFLALQAAARTFKNITITVTLKVGGKKVECTLYQFDHSANTSCRQAWLAGDNVGALAIPEAIATIAKLRPGAKLDDATLVVKSSKGKQPPSLPPKGLEKAVLAAWQEALGG
jgi:uncharacterized protein YjbI with pentapeptide repeats